MSVEARVWRRKHQLSERVFDVRCHYEGEDGINLVTIIGKATRAQVIDHVYGDSYGRGANDELWQFIDDRGVYFDLICDAIDRFQRVYGKSRRYHIEISTDHKTRDLLSFELTIHNNK